MAEMLSLFTCDLEELQKLEAATMDVRKQIISTKIQVDLASDECESCIESTYSTIVRARLWGFGVKREIVHWVCWRSWHFVESCKSRKSFVVELLLFTCEVKNKQERNEYIYKCVLSQTSDSDVHTSALCVTSSSWLSWPSQLFDPRHREGDRSRQTT